MAKNNRALLLRSAQKERIDLSTNVSLRNLDKFTFEAWVKVGSASGKSQRAFTIRQGGNQRRVRFAFTPIKDKLIFEVARKDGENDTNYTYPISWNDDRWHHVAFAADGPNSKYYIVVDGTQVQEGHLEGFGKDAEGTSLKISDTAATAVWIGGNNIDSDAYHYWDGKLDMLRLWSTLRSDSAIRGTMRTTLDYPDNETGLLGEWRLEDTGSSSISAVRPSNPPDGAWTGTLRRNGSAVTNLWTTDRPFLGDFEQDISEPSVPANFQAVNVSATSFDATWIESTDNVYVQYYEITVATTNTFAQPVRNWTARQIGRNTSIRVDGLDPATNYYARVRAFDANGNASDFATLGPVTTVSVGDTLPPNPPLLYAATNIDATAFQISWSRPSDDVGVTGYKIDVALDDTFSQYLTAYRNRNVGNVQSIYVNEGVPPATTLFVRVRAYDAAENESRSSEIVTVTTLPLPDTQAPSTVSVIEATAVESTRFIARWLPATDNVAVIGYRLDVSQSADFSTFVEGFEDRDVGDTLHYEVSPVEEQSTYYYRVRAYDAAGNISTNSEYVQQVNTLTKSLAELGLQSVTIAASDSASVHLTDDSTLMLGTVSTEFRSAMPVGRMLGTSPIESTGRFMLNETGGSVAINSGKSNYETLILPHGQYRGPITFGQSGPSKAGFGDDAKAVRFDHDGFEFGHVRLPETLPNQFLTNGTINDIYLWVKLNSYGASGGTLIEFASDEHGTNSARVHYDTSGRVLVSIYNGDVREVYFQTSTGALPLNQWTSILVNRSYVSAGNWTNRIFINGTEVLSAPTTAAFTFKHRPVRHLGRSMRPDQVNIHMDGEMFGVILGGQVSSTYSGYSSMENTAPVQQYLAAYRFPIADVGEGRIESYNLNLPLYNTSTREVRVYYLPNDAWGPSYFSRTEVDQRGSYLSVTTTGDEQDSIELDVTSLIQGDNDGSVSFLVSTVNGPTCDGMILGRHDDPNGKAPRLEMEIDYNAAVEPRTILVTPESVDLINFIKNPSGDGGTSSVVGVGGTLSLDSVNPKFGTNSFKFVSDGAVSNEHIQFLADSTLFGYVKDKLRGWVYLRSAAPITLSIKVYAVYSDSSAEHGTASVSLTTDWQRFATPVVNLDPSKTLSTLHLQVNGPSTPTAFTVWADGVLLTDLTDLQDPSITIPYFDASFEGVEPVGTLHNSASRYHATELVARSTYVGDNNNDATAVFEYRHDEDEEWTDVGVSIDRQTRTVTGVVPAFLPTSGDAWQPSLLPDALYHVRFVYDDPDGVRGIGEYGESILTPPPVDNILTVSDMSLSGGATYINVEITYTGDDNESALLSLEWKRTDRTHWSNISYAWDRQNKRITAHLPNLQQNTSYDVRATFSDGTAPIYGENPIVRTRITPFEEMALIGDAYIAFGGFVLLGPNTKNISVTEHDAFSAPEREVQYHSLARVDGEVEQYDIWRRKTVTMTGYISGETRQELAETVAAFKRAMTGRQQRLIIDTLDSRSFYNLATVTRLDIPQRGGEHIKHLQWTAEFVCADPFRYDTKETVEEDVPLNHGESVLATNTGDVQCEAFYTITTQQTITPLEVTLINRTSGVRVTPQATILAGDKLEIDTARLRVLKNGVEVDFAGGFPRLVRGSNELMMLFSPADTTTGPANARLTVRRRHRYF